MPEKRRPMPYPRPRHLQVATLRATRTFALAAFVVFALFLAEGEPYACAFGDHVHVFRRVVRRAASVTRCVTR